MSPKHLVSTFIVVLALLSSASGTTAQTSLPQGNMTQTAALAGSGAAPLAHPTPVEPESASATDSGPADSGPVITVTTAGFTPPVLTTTVGAEVTWYNATSQALLLKSGEPYYIYLPLVLRAAPGLSNVQRTTGAPGNPIALTGSEAFTGTLAPGGAFTHTFASPGEFPYYAATSPGFLGRIIVQALPDFAIAAWPVSQSITRSHSISFTVAVTTVQGAPQPVTLTWSGYPSATVAWSANPLTPTASATMAITPSLGGPTGAFALVITGSTGSLVHTTMVTLSVQSLAGLPPDPGAVAPPVDSSVATDFGSATAFLYTGDHPIQTGVVSGTMEVTRVAVLRGRVLDSGNSPLPGVQITVLDHPEFGQTLSREDGLFDLAVNGGGLLTINYNKSSYLPLQRKLDAPWRDYAWLPDVTLVAADPHVTAIDLASPAVQVAQGSVISDTDGARQATLFIPPGTTATLVFSNGLTQTLNSFHVRLTEYTVGERGPQAMPGELPPQSGYTYAAEYSVDEAVAAGAQDIIFNQPVIGYLDNFLSFTVGISVPLGYHDRQKNIWVASDSGRVIEILGIANGQAELDTDGDGTADDAAMLATLGITDAERAQLASLYPAGKSLWRMPVVHFTAWDANWGTRCKDDQCEFPQLPVGQPDPNPIPDDPNPQCGSLIGCENQVLGEATEIVGAPFSLHYSSARTPGHTQLQIPLSGNQLPQSIQGINLDIQVAGRHFSYTFPPQANLSYTFTWDGRDAYGRALQGQQPVVIDLSYDYQMEYVNTGRFGYNGAGLISASRARSLISLHKQWKDTIGWWDQRAAGLGGWDLDVHHGYDPVGRVIYLGDGSQRSAKAQLLDVITTVAGDGGYGYNGDGITATLASLKTPMGVAVGRDGSLYIADTYNMLVRRVGPDGVITTVAGNGTYTPYGDGGPATQASLSVPMEVAIGPDGSLYIADTGHETIRQVKPSGIITTVAGNGTAGYHGDGGPATQASLFTPQGVVIGPDGSLYIADTSNGRIRRVGPDGIITTVAGNSTPGFYGDGGPATQAGLLLPMGVAVGPDGSLYIVDMGNNRIRRVGSDGIISTVAGGGGGGATAYLPLSLHSITLWE